MLLIGWLITAVEFATFQLVILVYRSKIIEFINRFHKNENVLHDPNDLFKWYRASITSHQNLSVPS